MAYIAKKFRVLTNRIYTGIASRLLAGHKFADYDNAQDAVAAIVHAAQGAQFTVRDMQYTSWKNSEDKGFHNLPALDPEKLNVALKLLLIVSEVAEVLEEIRNGHGLNETYYSDKGKPEGVPAELADIAIRLGDLCGIAKVDLQDAVKEKQAYNAGREFMHGKTC